MPRSRTPASRHVDVPAAQGAGYPFLRIDVVRVSPSVDYVVALMVLKINPVVVFPKPGANSGHDLASIGRFIASAIDP
jgi:hypothetical protein